MKMKEYVVGLVINHAGTDILLVEKIKPPHMAGLWNGPGGKVEEGETPAEAMIRELKEETGISLSNLEMESAVAEMICHREGESDWRIWFFDIRLYTSELRMAKQMEEERIQIWKIREATDPFVTTLAPNLYWLIPFILNPHKARGWRLLCSEIWPKRV